MIVAALMLYIMIFKGNLVLLIVLIRLYYATINKQFLFWWLYTMQGDALLDTNCFRDGLFN